MACDDYIDKREVELIKRLHNTFKIFGNIRINSELEILSAAINKDSHKFFEDYLHELTIANLKRKMN